MLLAYSVSIKNVKKIKIIIIIEIYTLIINIMKLKLIEIKNKFFIYIIRIVNRHLDYFEEINFNQTVKVCLLLKV
jgi:hypothetical protein